MNNNIDELFEQIDDTETRYSTIKTLAEKGIFPSEKLLEETISYYIKTDDIPDAEEIVEETGIGNDLVIKALNGKALKYVMHGKYHYAAKVYEKIGNFEKAIYYYDISGEPNDLISASKLLEKSGNDNEAEKYYQKAIEKVYTRIDEDIFNNEIIKQGIEFITKNAKSPEEIIKFYRHLISKLEKIPPEKREGYRLGLPKISEMAAKYAKENGFEEDAKYFWRVSGKSCFTDWERESLAIERFKEAGDIEGMIWLVSQLPEGSYIYRDVIIELIKIGDFEKAEKFFNEYIKYGKDVKGESPIEIYQYNISYILDSDNEFEFIKRLAKNKKEKEMLLRNLEKDKNFKYAAKMAEELGLKKKAEAYRKIHELLISEDEWHFFDLF